MQGTMAPSLAQREHLLQVLPAEAVGLILEMLSFRDLIALRMTCKALSSWSQYAARSVEARLSHLQKQMAT